MPQPYRYYVGKLYLLALIHSLGGYSNASTPKPFLIDQFKFALGDDPVKLPAKDLKEALNRGLVDSV